MPARELRIPVEGHSTSAVSALLQEPSRTGRGSAILLAHGAGADMDSGFLAAIARGLSERGFPVLRFRYPYMEAHARGGARRPPDPPAVLESVHSAALAELRRRTPGLRAILCGKSLGGRIGTHLAAKGEDAAGLVLLGYPLHPAGRPGKERSEHFPAIVQPALFLQGNRDALCDLDRLRAALARYGGRATLAVVEGADHSFAVPARSGRGPEEVREELLGWIDRWEHATWPEGGE
ncbi:MAG TPA: alpha/beta family hydrolase [Planctomycetota bacterium]|nr:alpha/beta family hydrolase [Planctomycetota bacterium]